MITGFVIARFFMKTLIPNKLAHCTRKFFPNQQAIPGGLQWCMASMELHDLKFSLAMWNIYYLSLCLSPSSILQAILRTNDG